MWTYVLLRSLAAAGTLEEPVDFLTEHATRKTGALSTDSALPKPGTPPIINLFVCFF